MSDCDGSPPTPPPNAKPPVLVKEVDVMDGLVRAMNKQNPVEFSLPKHLVQDYAMPGSEKRLDAGTKFREADQKLDSDGMVPLPAKFCYSCGKTCRISPLIQCDYCSLLYHTECLNPPMNSLPSERWMCPNHIQNFIDDTMLTDNSKFTDKIAVYSKWNAIGRVDQEAIQLDFLSKVHQKNPPFSKKVYIPVKNPTKVPECVKQMYKKSSIERMRRIEAASYKTDKKKQEEWLYSMVKLQIDIADRIHCQSLPSLLTSPTSSTTSTTTTTATTTSTFLAACSIDTATSTTTTATSTTTSTSIDTTTTTTLEVVPSSSTPHETAGNTCLAICRSDATAPQPFSSSSSSLTSCSSTSVTSLPSSSSSSSSTYDTYLKSKFSRESCPPTANIPVVDATGLMGVTSSSNNNATTVGGAPAVVVDPTVTSGPVVLADTRPCESGTSSSTPDTGPSPAGNIIATGEAQAGTSEVTGEQAEASINTHAIPMDVTPATTSEPTTTTSDPNDTTTIPGAITMDIPTPEDNGGDSSSIGVVENQSLANNNGLSFGEKTRCTSQDTSSSPMDVEPTPSPTPSTSVAVISTPSSDAITNNSSSSGSSSGSGDRREATSFDPPHLTASPSSPPPASPTSHDQSIAENEEQTKHMNNIMKLDYKTICLLAAQRFKQLQPAKKMDEFPEEVITNTRKAKAIICPIDIPMNPVLMMTRTLKIGKGTDNDICLDNFGVCDYVSDNQAYIYFDQIERSYELLNNSEFGSMVDGAVYGLSPSSSPDLSDIGDGKDKLMLLKEKLKEPEPDPNVKPAMKSVKKKNSETCCCASGGLLLASDHTEGWEGAVVLHNHSRLQFGCLRFRFAYI